MKQSGGRKMEGMIRMTSHHYISWIIHLVTIGKAIMMTMILMTTIMVTMTMMTMTMTMMTSKAE